MSEEHLPVSVPLANDMGTVTFADDVIAIIAGLAASDIEGVAGMSGSIAGGFAEILGKKNLTKGVKVEVGNEQAAIDLSIIVNYGVKIIEVSRNIQESVKKAIETMTGLQVVEVNVHVLGVKFEKEDSAAKEIEAPAAPRVK